MTDFNIFNDEKKSQSGFKRLGSTVTHTFFVLFFQDSNLMKLVTSIKLQKSCKKRCKK